MHRPGVEPATFRSRVQRPSHYATELCVKTTFTVLSCIMLFGRRILHTSGFTAAERQSYTYLIHCNTLQSVVDVLGAMKQHGIPLAEQKAQVSRAPDVSIATGVVRCIVSQKILTQSFVHIFANY